MRDTSQRLSASEGRREALRPRTRRTRQGVTKNSGSSPHQGIIEQKELKQRCGICHRLLFHLDGTIAQDPVPRLSCKHMFHSSCLEAYFHRQSAREDIIDDSRETMAPCPTCAAPLPGRWETMGHASEFDWFWIPLLKASLDKLKPTGTGKPILLSSLERQVKVTTEGSVPQKALLLDILREQDKVLWRWNPVENSIWSNSWGLPPGSGLMDALISSLVAFAGLAIFIRWVLSS